MTIPLPHWDDELRHLAASGEARRLREAGGITLTTMAQALGIGKGCMSHLGHGRKRPGTDLGLRWLRVLRGLAWHEQAAMEPLAGLEEAS